MSLTTEHTRVNSPAIRRGPGPGPIDTWFRVCLAYHPNRGDRHIACTNRY